MWACGERNAGQRREVVVISRDAGNARVVPGERDAGRDRDDRSARAIVAQLSCAETERLCRAGPLARWTTEPRENERRGVETHHRGWCENAL
jgi:hypothetical protein